MKKILILALSLSVFVGVSGQEEYSSSDEEFRTIFQRNQGEPVFVSGFGGPMMTFTSIGDNFAHMMGGGGGVIVNDFFFGGYGMGLTTTFSYKGTLPQDDISLDFGHGGFWVGYVFGSSRPVHLSFSGQFGWGGISEAEDNGYYDYNEPYNTKPVFVMTPIAELELNFSHFFKVGLGSSITYVRGQGISETAYTVSDFARPSVYLSFKFGYFE